MFVYNITFVVSPETETELIDYIVKNLVPALLKPDSKASDPRLKRLVEAGGEKTGPDHGTSLALSIEFPSEKDAHTCFNRIIVPALGDFHKKFGEHALFFVTLLENIKI